MLEQRLGDLDHLDGMAQQLLALKPNPTSQFNVKKLLKQVKAMEKEVSLLRSSVSERHRESEEEESEGDELGAGPPSPSPRSRAPTRMTKTSSSLGG